MPFLQIDYRYEEQCEFVRRGMSVFARKPRMYNRNQIAAMEKPLINDKAVRKDPFMTAKYRWEEDKNRVVIEARLKAPQATDSQEPNSVSSL
jgi:hypothetical protein